MYQHYSFDLWLTLIKSNPYFKIERTKIFHRDFNPGGKSIDDVASAFRQVDLMCNAVNERTGKNIDADEMYLMVISAINDNQYPLADVNIDKLYADMETLLFYYLPVLYSPVTIEVLQHLKQKGDCSLSILSNTGFIKGQTLRKVMVKLGLDTFFNFQIYSDEEGMSKPNRELFNLMVQKVKDCNKPKQISLTDIIHIGDNPAADIAGANDAGLNSLLINSNNLPILTLLSL
ncbi:HAD family hydrolase [Mucilaginibacter gossypii]|uniref:HAD family hydrolase n=1 Tax=Mucilaginibacter gossypii TaxID=551996 RepID=UPI000DCD5B0E|nr:MULTISPECIES: HAD family hydrolase [Mucilaginibacter]QTE36169.1 HAD family hydrolase [Mucilaginibacter gossypii]RAV60242.1 HAD family hydrolase [Mucilaginibacter rubeus]